MEFQKVMEEFERMCDFYDQKNELYCSPLYKETGSESWEDWCTYASTYPEEFESIVTKWAQQHPKPVYPTIGGLVAHMKNYLPERKDGKHWDSVSFEELLRQEVPKEVAEELGIVPINECGLNKYVEEESEWR